MSDSLVMPRIGVVVSPKPKPVTSRFRDLEGYKRERITVGRYCGIVRGQAIWEVFCECGRTLPMSRRAITNPKIISCGCFAKGRLTTHGMKGSREYRVWLGIKGRCETPSNGNYGPYGGSGVRLYGPWSDSFEQFLADVGRCPSDEHTIDRYPSRNGNYEPGNVRWATKREQNTNKKSNHFVTIGDETLAIVDWSEKSGVDRRVISDRLSRGWDPQLAVFSPVGSRKRRTSYGKEEIRPGSTHGSGT